MLAISNLTGKPVPEYLSHPPQEELLERVSLSSFFAISSMFWWWEDYYAPFVYVLRLGSPDYWCLLSPVFPS